MMELIVFNLLGGTYAIALKQIKMILVHSQTNITPLYNEHPWISGLINLRGDVAPIVDLRIRFGKNEPDFTEDTVIIIVRTDTDKLIGLIVENIKTIREIDTKFIVHQPELGIGINSDYLSGLYKNSEDEMITLLNIDKILNVDTL